MTQPTDKHRELAQKLFRSSGNMVRFSSESEFVALAAQHLSEFEAELTGWKPIDKGMASAQPCETNDKLNELRLKCFKSNSHEDREAYFTALNIAFQRGDLIAYDLPTQPEKEGSDSLD